MIPYDIEFPSAPPSTRYSMSAACVALVHVPKADFHRIHEDPEGLAACVAIITDEHGYILNIDHMEDVADELPGFSPEFHRLIHTFVTRGWSFIRLDYDGEEVEGLPTYTWN